MRTQTGSCPNCGAAFIGSETCLNCRSDERVDAAVVGTDAPQKTGSRRVPIVVLVALIVGAAGVVFAQRTFGDRFPGSETITRTGVEAVPGAPTCQYGDIEAACVVAHVDEDAWPMGPVGPWPLSAELEGPVLFGTRDGVMLVGGEGVVWETQLGRVDPDRGETYWLLWQSEDALLITKGFRPRSGLAALDPTTGHILWRRDVLEGRDLEAFAAVVVEDVLVVEAFSGPSWLLGIDPSSPDVVEEDVEMAILGVDPWTGAELWHATVVGGRALNQPRLYYQDNEGGGVCLDPSSGVLATASSADECMLAATSRGFELIVPDEDGRLAFNPPDGRRWSLDDAEFPIDLDDRAVLTVDEQANALRLRALMDGSEIWKVELMQVFGLLVGVPPPFGVSGVLFNDMAVIASGSGSGSAMVALQRTDGSVRWRVDTEAGMAWDMDLASAGDRLYASNADGLHLLDRGDGTTIWTFPSRGFVASRDGSRLILFGHTGSGVWVLDPPR